MREVCLTLTLACIVGGLLYVIRTGDTRGGIIIVLIGHVILVVYRNFGKGDNAP